MTWEQVAIALLAAVVVILMLDVIDLMHQKRSMQKEIFTLEVQVRSLEKLTSEIVEECSKLER